MTSGHNAGITQKRCSSAYGMFLFFLLLPFEYPLATFGLGSILRYVGIAVMGLAAVDILQKGGKVRMDHRIILLLLWMVYAIISGIWCADTSRYSYYISMYINNALMFLVVTAVPYTYKDVELIRKGFVGGTIALLLYMTFIPGAVVSSSWQSRLTLAYKGRELLDQNYLAALMVMQFGIVLYDFLNEKKREFTRVMMAVFCLAVIYYILRTGSRGGLLAAGVVTFLCMCMGLKKRSKAMWIILGVVLVLAPAVLSALPDDLLERFSLDAMLGNTSESGGRLQIWKIAWEAIKSGNIIFGYGAGAAETVIGWRYRDDAATHNALIAQMLELGVVGLGLLLSLIVNMFRETWRNQDRALCFAFCGIAVISMFLDVLTTKFFWGAMMMVSVQISAHNTHKKQQRMQMNIRAES